MRLRKIHRAKRARAKLLAPHDVFARPFPLPLVPALRSKAPPAPFVSVVPPADTTVRPPAPLPPVPAPIDTEPAAPPVAHPVPTVVDPEHPPCEEPEQSETSPLVPETEESADPTVT